MFYISFARGFTKYTLTIKNIKEYNMLKLNSKGVIMYKLIAMDFDGTLLDSYGQVTTRNKEAINKAMEQGVKVVLASGRGTMSVKNFATELETNEYMICGNGAIVYDLKEKQIIYENFLSKEKVLQLIDICEENSIYYSIYTEKGIISKSLNYNVLFYNHENANKPDCKKTNIYLTDDVRQYILNREETDYTKITVCDNNNIIFNSVIKKLRNVKKIDVLDVGHMTRKLMKMGTEQYSIEYFYTEITNEKTDKWNAINFLIEKLGIKKEEVIAIGDNVNDQTMLENAGLGVAMENSAPYIQKMGDVVTSSNNDDGVAKAIEKYVLEQ